MASDSQVQQGEIQQIQLDMKGLYTNPNDLSKVPTGALLEATNIVIDRDGIGEQRRGLKKYGVALAWSAVPPDSVVSYQDRLIVHYENTFVYDNDGAGGAWTAYAGTYGVPTGAEAVCYAQANKNLYLGTNKGILKLDAYNAAFRAAGVPRGLDGSGTADDSGWFADSTQVAYRIVWGYMDANSNLLLGAPSERIVVANTTGSPSNVDLTFSIPATITTSYFYQVYRSPQSVDLSTTPNDECQLVLQASPSASDISNGYVALTDSIPEELLGATIYTAQSQQGINQSNFQPPIAVDMTTFKGHTFYANTVGRHFIDLSLLAVDGTGLAEDDTITIAGVVYTAKAAEDATAGEFLCQTSGTASENIDASARSLVHVINTYASNTLAYAYYVSGFNDLPGNIMIEERGIGGSSFTLSVSNAAAWFFQSGTSSNETYPGRVYISKHQQPEAVPALNYLDVGSALSEIYRIIALRNSVFIFKEDGVFRLTGDDISSFAVTPWDTTVNLRSPRGAVLLNNQIYCFTTQGVISVSETGSAITSRPIEVDLLHISASQFTYFDSASFGLGYESDRKYIFATVSAEGDQVATQIYVYNYITNTWVRWVLPHTVSAGILNPVDNRLYLVSADSDFKYLIQERKNYTSTDYADDEVALTVTGSSGTTVEVADTTGVEAGWDLTQELTSSPITEVTDGTHLVVEDTVTWNNAAAIAYCPISVAVKWAPIHGGNPTITKLFQELEFFFSNPDFDSLTIAVSSNFSQYDESFDIVPVSLGGWGAAPWGTEPWGGGRGEIQPIRSWTPKEKCRAHWLLIKLTCAQSLRTFALNGLTIKAVTMGYRFK